MHSPFFYFKWPSISHLVAVHLRSQTSLCLQDHPRRMGYCWCLTHRLMSSKLMLYHWTHPIQVWLRTLPPFSLSQGNFPHFTSSAQKFFLEESIKEYSFTKMQVLNVSKYLPYSSLQEFAFNRVWRETLSTEIRNPHVVAGVGSDFKNSGR